MSRLDSPPLRLVIHVIQGSAVSVPMRFAVLTFVVLTASLASAQQLDPLRTRLTALQAEVPNEPVGGEGELIAMPSAAVARGLGEVFVEALERGEHGMAREALASLVELIVFGAPGALDTMVFLARESPGGGHSGILEVLTQLAEGFYAGGDFAATRKVLAAKLALQETALGRRHEAVGQTLDLLAATVRRQGLLPQAEDFYRRALEIHRARLGLPSEVVAQSAFNLGFVLVEQGHLARALPLYEEALANFEGVHGEHHLHLATVLQALAALNSELRNPDRARASLDRALAIVERSPGVEPSRVPVLLMNRAALELGQGDPAAAQTLLARALPLLESAVGNPHPLLAEAEEVLARAHVLAAELQAAETVYRRVLSGRVSTLGPYHPAVARTLEALADLAVRRDQPARVESLELQAYSVWRDTVGEQHPTSLASRLRWATRELDMGRPAEALARIEASVASWSDRLPATLASLTDGEAYVYLATVLDQIELQQALAIAEGDDAALVRAYQALVFWKGQLTRCQVVPHEARLAALGDVRQSLLRELAAAQGGLTTSALQTVDMNKLGQFGRRRDELEGRLLETFAGSAVSFSELATALPAGAALVDLFVHRPWPEDQRHGLPQLAGHVTAWVVRAGKLTPVDLGPATALRAALAAQLAKPAASGAGDALSELLWAPLAVPLHGVQDLLLSGDDFLRELPFSTLTSVSGKRLGLALTCVTVNDVSARSKPHPGRELSLLSVAPADGMTPPSWVLAELHSAQFGEQGRRLRLAGSDVSRDRLIQELPGYDVLHLSLPGVGLSASDATLWERTRRIRGDVSGALLEELTTFELGHGAGLAYAPVGDGDSVLSAADIAALDLSGVELVVLSGADVDVTLRHAFHAAGVHHVLLARDPSLLFELFTSVWVSETPLPLALARILRERLAAPSGTGSGAVLSVATP